MENLKLHLKKITDLGNSKADNMTVHQKITSQFYINMILCKIKNGKNIDVYQAQELADASAEYSNILIETMISPDQELINYINIPENS
jgi:hypothetical protein